MSGNLLILEDDAILAMTLATAFRRRGYTVRILHEFSDLVRLTPAQEPDYAVVDLKLGSASGLKAVQLLRSRSETIRIVVLTGFASIGTAVEAIKLGADHYLAKPCGIDELERAFDRTTGNPEAPICGRKSTLKMFEWERINSTLADCEFNISETARQLGMHRRTLARKLAKVHVI